MVGNTEMKVGKDGAMSITHTHNGVNIKRIKCNTMVHDGSTHGRRQSTYGK